MPVPLPSASAELLPPDALPRGFRFSAVRAGIKPSGKPDLACAVADGPSAAAALFTSNRVAAAPVLLGREHLKATGGLVRALVVNSGNANCATGEAGLAAARQSCLAAGAAFGCPAEQVLPCSTGIIGVPLPVDRLVAALPAAADALEASAAGFLAFAQAILTTDTRAKVAYRVVETAQGTVRLAGACKGAGMIQPRLTGEISPAKQAVDSRHHATMLAYLFTDARLEAAALQTLLAPAVETSFNRISIDGDTSTNDTVVLLASGASGVLVSAADAAFREALAAVCHDLAQAIVADGEGVTHVVTLRVQGAPSDEDALHVARSIANSPLVKTAWAGGDPNWGRIASAVGASGILVDPDRLSIAIAGLPVCAHGGRAPAFDEAAVHAAMAEPRFTVEVKLGLGAGACEFWTTDLTTEYVRINADYSS